jgi:phage terminase small subunit
VGKTARFASPLRCRTAVAADRRAILGELRPWRAFSARELNDLLKLSREFGLTPAARSRIVAQTETEPEDDLWALLNAPREPVYPSQPEPKPH